VRPITLVVALSLCSAARAQAQLFRYLDPSSPGLGWSVRAIGDVDHDGTTELALGSFRYDCGFAGCSSGPSKVTLLSGATQTVLWSFVPTVFDGSGEALDAIGDFDGDGTPDVLVGAPYFGGVINQAGQVRIQSGVDGSVLQTFASLAPHTNFGISVASLGDVDDDTIADVAIATVDTVYICSGATAAPLSTIPPAFAFPSSTRVWRYGDFDHDGHDDVLVGQASSDPNVSGSVRIVSGSTGLVLHTYAASTLRPTFGWAVCATNDFDADGEPDLVVGSPEFDTGGATSGFGFVDLIGSATGNVVFGFSGAQSNEHLGIAVAGGADFDGDGVGDIAAASTCDSNNPACTRYANVWSGATGQLLWTATSTSTGSYGATVEFVGDLTSDGRSEFAFGSPCSTFFATCGEVRVYNDQATGPTAYCTAGTTSNGCTPSISASGIPSASAASGFTIHVAQVEGQRAALFLYGINGRMAQPWGSGGTSFLCVVSPLQRFGSQNSGGTGFQCDGALATDWLAYIAAHPTALGAPFSAGDIVDAQAWFRDPPAPRGTNLSNALEFVLAP
jgi:hypothetical protein